MEKLIELANAGVEISMFGPYSYREGWKLTATKSDDGSELKVSAESIDLYAAINDLYERWVRATSKGLPNLGLRQIEHIVPPKEDLASRPSIYDEIPF